MIEVAKGGKKLLVKYKGFRYATASLQCHGNSDVNRAWIKTDFNLYIIQLW